MRDAIAKMRREKEDGRRVIEEGDRKRKYHSSYEAKAPSAVEFEAYQLTKIHSADPMAALMERKEVEEEVQGKGKKRKN